MITDTSTSNIHLVLNYCKALFRNCRQRGGAFEEISREVRGLHTVLKRLKIEFEASTSLPERDVSIWQSLLMPKIRGCDDTLHRLEGLIARHENGSKNNGESSKSDNYNREHGQSQYDSNEMDDLGSIRVALISHKKSLTVFCDQLHLNHAGEKEIHSRSQEEELDELLDKVDIVAARMLHNSKDGLFDIEDDHAESWRRFKKNLVGEGVSNDNLHAHEAVIRSYVHEIKQRGLLHELNIDDTNMNAPHTNQISSPKTSGSSLKQPGSMSESGAMSSIGTVPKTVKFASDNKGVPARNSEKDTTHALKFDQHRPPKVQESSVAEMQLPTPPFPAKNNDESQPTRQSIPLQPASLSSRTADNNGDTDDTIDKESETDDEVNLSHRASPSTQIITTMELVNCLRAEMIKTTRLSKTPPSASSSFDERWTTESLESRTQKQPDLSTLSSRPSAWPESIRLAPDSHGIEIDSKAKWTKINRQLVSPEVLNQDGKRFEACPDFVAVLGELPRADIQSLAARSYKLRASRQIKKRTTAYYKAAHLMPEQPPIIANDRNPLESGQQSSSKLSIETQNHDISYDRDYNDRGHYEGRRSYPIYSHSPNTGYPMYFDSSFVSPGPLQSPGTYGHKQDQPIGSQTSFRPSTSPVTDQRGNWPQYSPRYRGDDWSWDREPEPRRRHSSPPRTKSKDKMREYKSRDNKTKDKEKRSRWKDSIAAAGIGGAAASIINVLSEAAEGL